MVTQEVELDFNFTQSTHKLYNIIIFLLWKYGSISIMETKRTLIW